LEGKKGESNQEAITFWEFLPPPLPQDHQSQCHNTAQKGWTQADENNPKQEFNTCLSFFSKWFLLLAEGKLINFSNTLSNVLISTKHSNNKKQYLLMVKKMSKEKVPYLENKKQ